MQFKWRFFKFSSYFHIGLALTLVSIMFLRFSDPSSSSQHWSYIIFFLCTGLLITNSVNNIILLEKYFPEKLPSKGFAVFTKIIFAFSLLPLALVGVVLAVANHFNFRVADLPYGSSYLLVPGGAAQNHTP